MKFNTSILNIFGKKSKDADDAQEALSNLNNEALQALNNILSSQIPQGEYSGSGRRKVIKQDIMPYTSEKGESGFKRRQIVEFDTPEGKRYYPGEGTSRSMDKTFAAALGEATHRKELSPADSITTDQLKVLKELGLF
tara:strand:- start:6804 stop:7217 length:414 start_codon:yes stop_codon:yes gene_type:complete